MRGFVVICRGNKGEEEMGKGKRGVRPPSHNLNITDRY
jgi:hypothetical protein